MGGLVGIGFSIKINPIHTKIHVFITAFRADCLIHKNGYENKSFSSPPLNVWFRVAEHKSRCTVPEQPTVCLFERGP